MQIKVCGMCEGNNILEIAQIPNITYLGFIFTPLSKRFVGEEFEMPFLPKNIQKIGVFLDQNVTEILEKCLKYNLDGIQLHGNESPEYCQNLKILLQKQFEILPKIIKVFSIDNNFDDTILENYEKDNVCDFFLFDTKGKEAGGNGVSFNWEILKGKIFKKPIFLSGGISLENSENLCNFLKNNPQIPVVCLDINSKFEKNIALKDAALIKNWELEIRNGELEIRNGELEIRNGELEIRNGELEIRNGELEIRNGELEIKN